MATEHIIHIRLEFDDVTQGVINKTEAGMEKIAKPMADGVREQMARSGGAASIEIGNMQKAWTQFDWAHPIASLEQIWQQKIQAMESRFGKFTMAVLGFIGGMAISALKQAVDVQDRLVKTFVQLQTSVNFGTGAVTNLGEKVAISLSQIGQLAMETGGDMIQLTSLFTQLAKARVPVQDLKDLTRLSYLGAKAMGANVDQFGELMGLLKVQGGLSEEQLGPHGMMGELLKVQGAAGLTENELSAMFTTVSGLTLKMKALGATKEDILAMVEATGKLTGVFAQLGLGADRAGQIMNKLMDPTQVGENALLIRNMGMSMQDYLNMLSKGTIDQNKLTYGLVNAAKRVQAMHDSGANIIAQNQYAMMMGFTNVQEALKLAQQGGQALDKMKSSAVDFEAKAAEGMSSIKEQWGHLKGVITGAFAQPLSKLMGVLTNVFAKIGEVVLKNMPKITAWMDKLGATLVKIDWAKVGERIGHIFEILVKGIPLLIKLLPILGGLFIVFKGFKAIGGLFGGGGGEGGGVLGGVGKGIGSFTKALPGAAKMLAAGASILLIAGALWVLSMALLNFMKVDWGAMAKAGVALGVLILVLVGVGLLLGSVPEIAGGMVVFAATMLMLAAAIWILSKAIQNLDPTHIQALADIASPKLILQMLELGAALAALSVSMILVGPMAAMKLVALGIAIKDLALGLYVLGKAPPVEELAKQLVGVSAAINAMNQAKFKGNAKEIGEGFKEIVGGISDLANIDISKLAGLSGVMQDMAKGIASWLDAMSQKSGRGGIASFLGLVPDLKATAEAFKDIALGVYVFGASAKMQPDIRTMMNALPDMMDAVVASLKKFEQVKNVADTFRGMLQDMREAAVAPINITAQGQGGPAGGATAAGTMGYGGTQSNPQAGNAPPPNTGVDSIVDAIKDLQNVLIDRTEQQLAQLANISKFTRLAVHG